ncbi:MAG: phage regulatory CII family protein [Desulfovibrionaceae bacterium]
MSYDKTVTVVVQNMLLESRSAKDIAQSIGKTYPALMREINPFDRNAKLGADTLLEIMKTTKDIRPLEFMAEELGWKLTAMNQNSQ